jgi:hypothetical protein
MSSESTRGRYPDSIIAAGTAPWQSLWKEGIPLPAPDGKEERDRRMTCSPEDVTVENHPMKHLPLIAAILFPGILNAPASAQWDATAEMEYVQRFEEKFPPVSPVPTLDEYATAARYDKLFLGAGFEKAVETIRDNPESLAWGWSYRMMSLNEMYRATKDPKYFIAGAAVIQTVISVRDDRLGLKMWTGETAPAWGSGNYAERGRSVFAVHTGMITYPILDFLLIAKENPGLGDTLGRERDRMLRAAEEALAFHDRQWRDGPEEGAGHYMALNQESKMEGLPLPGNRLSAMGRALWLSWKVTGNETHRARALALGRYIKARLTPSPDGAYYWSYVLPRQPVTEPRPKEEIPGAEDVSHASLTASFPIMLASDGEIFTEEDMERIGLTVEKGFARLDSGVLFGNVVGELGSGPGNVQMPGRWLRLSPFAPEVYDRIAEFYLKYRPTPSPLALALLVRYREVAGE